MKFQDYFPCSMEYGDPTSIDIGTPGWRLDYISSSFLNGWVNYAEPIKAFTISRYHPSKELAVTVEDFKLKLTPHADFSRKEWDDVIILSRDALGDYWFFHYDRDCSDCSIGRAKAMHQEEIVGSFECYIREVAQYFGDGQEGGDGTVFELPVDKITGWIQG